MGISYQRCGMKRMAMENLQKALVIHAGSLGLNHPGTESLMGALTEVNQMQESKTDPDQKREIIEKGIEFVEKLVRDHKNFIDKFAPKDATAVGGDTVFFDHAGHVGHGAQGDTQRYRAEKHWFPAEGGASPSGGAGGGGGIIQ